MTEGLRRFSLVVSCVLAIAGPRETTAQQIIGRLTDARGLPSIGALIVARRPMPDSLTRRTVTSQDGGFALELPAGRYRIEALRIGHRPIVLGEFTLTEGERRRMDASLPDSPIVLATVTTRGTSRCALPSRAGQAVVTLFEEARKALTLSLMVPSNGRPVARIVVSNQLTDPRGVPLGPPTREIRVGTSSRPFQSISPELISRFGYVTTDESGSTYRAPDAGVILSPQFAAAHCMRVVDGTGDDARLVGLAFRPASLERGLVDVEGTLWIERSSMQLDRIEFAYVGLPPALRRANLGGKVAFTRAPDGLWFEDRWEIRMPRTAVIAQYAIGRAGSNNSPRAEVLEAIQVVRGEVLALETAGRITFVGNTALDDSLRDESEVGVKVAAVTDLTDAPSCREARPDSEPSATVFGTVFELPPARSPGAQVTARWREEFRAVGRFDFQWIDRELASTTADDGFFSFCSIPRARIIRVQAAKEGRRTPVVGARVPWETDRARVNLQFVESPPASAPRRTVPIRVVGPGGSPIPFAVVDAGPGVTRVADSSGIAHMPQLDNDAQRIRVRRIGFAVLDTVLALRGGNTELRVELHPLGQLLDAVTVTAAASSPLVRAGFYDRIQRVQRGAIAAEFVSPEEIEMRSAAQVSDLLRGRRTITVTRGLSPPRTIVKGRGGCDMTVLLDGQRIQPDDGASEGPIAIDDLVSGRNVMAIEIYPSTANAPSELIPLTGGGSCGIIAIWTGAP